MLRQFGIAAHSEIQTLDAAAQAHVPHHPAFPSQGTAAQLRQRTSDSLGSAVVPFCKISPLVLSQRNTKVSPPVQYAGKKLPLHRSMHGILHVHYALEVVSLRCSSFQSSGNRPSRIVTGFGGQPGM